MLVDLESILLLEQRDFLKKHRMIANYKNTQQIFFCESSLDNLTLCQANVKSVEKRSG